MTVDDDRPIRERLAEARGGDEVVGILGRPRLIGYGVGFGLGAVAMVAASLYLIVEVATGRRSAWVLAALPALLLLGCFCAVIAYGFAYFVVTGHRWPGADRVGAIARRLNSNI